MSSVTAMVMVCVESAGELAGKVTVPEVVPKSALSAASAVNGALHATCTCDATAASSATVKTAFPPSVTFSVGPVILRSALSSSLGSSVVVPLWSLRVIVASN